MEKSMGLVAVLVEDAAITRGNSGIQVGCGGFGLEMYWCYSLLIDVVVTAVLPLCKGM